MGDRLRALIAAAAGGLLVLLAPAPASGHSVVRVAGDIVAYTSSDATSLNSLAVRLAGDEIELRDPSVDGGIDQGPCRPGETNSAGFVIQVFCPRAGTTRVRIDLGEREDTLEAALPLVTEAVGGPGADRLTSADGADLLVGNDGADRIVAGAGHDVVEAGNGADEVDAGAGDDGVRVRDGIADRVLCGEGSDTVDADQLDLLDGCESVTRTETVPPTGSDGSGDTDAPLLRVSAVTVQRIGGGRRSISVSATSSEAGRIAASGLIDIDGLRVPLDTVSRRVKKNVRATLVFTLSRRTLHEAQRSLRKNRRVVVRLGVVATDTAGNSTQANAPAIRVFARKKT